MPLLLLCPSAKQFKKITQITGCKCLARTVSIFKNKTNKNTDLIVQPSLWDVLISYSNWTEWSTIQGVIAQVISKSDEREARG